MLSSAGHVSWRWSLVGAFCIDRELSILTTDPINIAHFGSLINFMNDQPQIWRSAATLPDMSRKSFQSSFGFCDLFHVKWKVVLKYFIMMFVTRKACSSTNRHSVGQYWDICPGFKQCVFCGKYDFSLWWLAHAVLNIWSVSSVSCGLVIVKHCFVTM